MSWEDKVEVAAYAKASTDAKALADVSAPWEAEAAEWGDLYLCWTFKLYSDCTMSQNK